MVVETQKLKYVSLTLKGIRKKSPSPTEYAICISFLLATPDTTSSHAVDSTCMPVAVAIAPATVQAHVGYGDEQQCRLLTTSSCRARR
jgi:hypothetical protein